MKNNENLIKHEDLVNEVKSLSAKLKDSLKVNINRLDTFYIISGYDITTGTSYGKAWNKNIIIYYTFDREFENNKVTTTSINIYKSKIKRFDNFSDILPYIESWNTAKINNYVKLSNEKILVLGGISSWNIIRSVKIKNKHHLYLLRISDFARN